MAAEDPSKSSGGDSSSKAGEDESKPEAPRPKGAPNRFQNLFCLLKIDKLNLLQYQPQNIGDCSS